MSNKKKLGEITITMYETNDGYKAETRFSNNIPVDISGVRTLIKTFHTLEKTIAKQVLNSMINDDDDFLKSIFLDN